jgi:glycosyltransferase involved in cell wall biosynthesis
VDPEIIIPRVSIIIPCYNSSVYIEDCVKSALKQTWKNVEVIFVDNESDDNSVEVVEEIQEEYPDLIMDSAENIYPHCWDEARQRGFELMTGDYVLVMGSDDLLHERFIENCMIYIMSAPQKISALQSPMASIINVKGQWGIDSNNIITHTYRSIDQFKELCLKACPVNTPTVIYNTKLYHDGLLKANPEAYGGAADYDLYCRLADQEVMIYPADQWIGFYYRWHPDQATWKVKKEGKGYDRHIQNYWSKKWNAED